MNKKSKPGKLLKKIEKTKIRNLSNITQKWVNILIPFSRDYNKKISGSELARIK